MREAGVRWMWWAFGTVGLTVVAALAAAQSAMACSCVTVPAGEKLRQSEAAVVARLLEVRPVEGGDNAPSSADPTDFVYRTGRVVKGRSRLRKGRRLIVRSARDDASCGLSGRVGQLTGLFLARDEDRWTSGSCQEVAARQMRRLVRSTPGSATDERCSA